MTFKFKVKHKCGRQNVVFSIKTACISETVSDMAKVTADLLIATHIHKLKLSIGTTFDDLE